MLRSFALAVAVAWVSVAWVSLVASAAPLGQQDIVNLCGNAEDAGHCGRIIEEAQLKRLPNLARREGSALVISLYPSGTTTFKDSDDPVNGRSYSLWDFLDPINAVVLYSTAGDSISFIVLRRTSNRRFELPAEPHLSPDRLHIVTADVCPDHCVNEIAVWSVSSDALRKEWVWTPRAAWSDVNASWKDSTTLTIEYTPAGTDKPVVVERKLADPVWKRIPPD